MTDLSRIPGAPGTSSEDGPALDPAFPITVDSRPGGDGMSEESPGEDPPPTPTGALHVITPG